MGVNQGNAIRSAFLKGNLGGCKVEWLEEARVDERAQLAQAREGGVLVDGGERGNGEK